MKRRRTGRSDKTDGKERNNSKKPVKRFISGRHRDCTMRNMVINVLYEYIHNYNVNTTLQRTRTVYLSYQNSLILRLFWRRGGGVRGRLDGRKKRAREARRKEEGKAEIVEERGTIARKKDRQWMYKDLEEKKTKP